MSVEDYRINAFVRALLVRRWIDTSRVDFGTSNGVVYVRGVLRRIYGRRQIEEDHEVDDLVSLMRRVEREMKGIPGVKDVVFKLDNLEKSGGQWRRKIKMFP